MLLEEINEGNSCAKRNSLYSVPVYYTQEDVADAIDLARETMSRYCTINPKTGCPRGTPGLHIVIKIIAVLGANQAEAYDALRMTMHCIDDVESYPFLKEYQAIVNDPECKSRDKYNIQLVTEIINDHLEKAIKLGAKTKGSHTINTVFVRR